MTDKENFERWKEGLENKAKQHSLKHRERLVEPDYRIARKHIQDMAGDLREQAIQEANKKRAAIASPGAYTISMMSGQIDVELRQRLREINEWEQQEIKKLSQPNE